MEQTAHAPTLNESFGPTVERRTVKLAGLPEEKKRLGIPGPFSKAMSQIKRLGDIRNVTFEEAMGATAAHTQRAVAETSAAVRGVTMGATGLIGGLCEGIFRGGLAGLSGTDEVFLACLATKEINPERIGTVAEVVKKQDVPFATIRLEKDLYGNPQPNGTYSEPTPIAAASYYRVNFGGDRFKAAILPIKGTDAKTGREGVVGFMAIDDRNSDNMPVYRIMR